jgi:hypothetical protein
MCLPFEIVGRDAIDMHFSNWENFFKRICGDVYQTTDFVWLGLFTQIVFAVVSVMMLKNHEKNWTKYIT